MGRKLITDLAPAPPTDQLSLGWNSTASLGGLWRAGGSLDNADRNYGRTFDGHLGEMVWAKDTDHIATTGTGEVPRKFGPKFARAYSKMDGGMAESDRTDCYFHRRNGQGRGARRIDEYGSRSRGGAHTCTDGPVARRMSRAGPAALGVMGS